MDVIFKGQTGRILTNTLFITNKAGNGDCTVRSETGNSWLAQSVRTAYESFALDTILDRFDSGKTVTNAGALGIVTVSLPVPGGAGVHFNFVRLASQAFRINPQGADAIIYSGGQMSNGEYLELASDGAKLSLISDDNNNWIATVEFGTLTEETP